MWVPLNFRERLHWLWSLTKCSRWPTERAWFSCKMEKTSLWFWPRIWHTPPTLWPEGSQHQQVSRWHKASHLTLKTEVLERQQRGSAFPEPSASPLVVKGGEKQACFCRPSSGSSEKRTSQSPDHHIITHLSWLPHIGSDIHFLVHIPARHGKP